MRRTIRRWRIVTEGLRLVVGHGAYTAKHGEILARRLRPLPRLRGRAGEGKPLAHAPGASPSPPSPQAGEGEQALNAGERTRAPCLPYVFTPAAWATAAQRLISAVR